MIALMRCNSLLILCIIIGWLAISCDQKCEAFDFDRLPFDRAYYQKWLTYTNGHDTIVLTPNNFEYSKQSVLDSYSNPQCNPHFEVWFRDKKNRLAILYSFDYSPDEDNRMSLFLDINASELNLDCDSIAAKSNLGKQVVFDNIKQPNHPRLRDSTRMIKSLAMQYMRITELETFSGAKWKLIR